MKFELDNPFPELPLEAWEESKITLHLWLQIVGKVKLDLMPWRNHWWNITFHLSPNGLTTRPIPHQKGSFQVDFDLLNDSLFVRSSWSKEKVIKLSDGLTVKEFYNNFFSIMDELGIKTNIIPEPYDHPCEDSFGSCESYNRYDSLYVKRFWRVLQTVDQVFNEFSGKYYGKMSPSHLYWHHMDLAVTRFSGNQGPDMDGSVSIADKEAYSHEVISAGFWAGDEKVRGAAFYSYTYPSPEGIEKEVLLPDVANWVDSNGSPMATLMYDDLITRPNPKEDLMKFLQSSYEAGAKLAKWDSHLTIE